MWWNPTAAALVVAKIGSAIYARETGASFTQMLLIYPFFDIFVLSVIASKDEHCNLRPYVSALHQFKCILLERSPSDRAVILVFAAMWVIYVAPIHDYYRWWMLFGGVILQFLFASAESLEIFWRGRAVSKSVSPILDLHLIEIHQRRDADAARNMPPGLLLVTDRGAGYG